MRTVVVTGATSGIGFAVCQTLLEAGFAVIGVGKSEENCQSALSKLSKRRSDDIRFICADLMHQSEVLRTAHEIERIIGEDLAKSKLHALINNAGCVRSRYMTSHEGYEQQFALNYLAGFLLTETLMHRIMSDDAAVIFTGSRSHKMMRVNWDDLMFRRRYRPLYAYKQSKLCNMLLAYQLRSRGVRACGVDPGLVCTEIGNKDTFGIVDYVWKARKKRGKPPSEPAKIYRFLCENGFDGLYYASGTSGARERPVSRQVNEENAQRLYNVSLKLCGLEDTI